MHFHFRVALYEIWLFLFGDALDDEKMLYGFPSSGTPRSRPSMARDFLCGWISSAPWQIVLLATVQYRSLISLASGKMTNSFALISFLAQTLVTTNGLTHNLEPGQVRLPPRAWSILEGWV